MEILSCHALVAGLDIINDHPSAKGTWLKVHPHLHFLTTAVAMKFSNALDLSIERVLKKPIIYDISFTLVYE